MRRLELLARVGDGDAKRIDVHRGNHRTQSVRSL
jgi:hypothetical protein